MLQLSKKAVRKIIDLPLLLRRSIKESCPFQRIAQVADLLGRQGQLDKIVTLPQNLDLHCVPFLVFDSTSGNLRCQGVDCSKA